jgi:hypothetical protein
MSTLGVVVLSVCGMKHLTECLESVGWADTVVVLHVGRGEPAVEPGRSVATVTGKVPSAPEMAEISQKIRTDWVLHLWGDERVGTELKEQLLMVSREGTRRTPSEYRIPIRSRVLGRWVPGSLWGSSPGTRLSHSVMNISPEWWNERQKEICAASKTLRGWIEDYTLADLSDGFDRIHHVTSFWAERLNGAGWSYSPLSVVLRPLRIFLRLLWRNGIVGQGLPGLTLSTLAAYATLLSGAKVWELRNIKGKEER